MHLKARYHLLLENALGQWREAMTTDKQLIHALLCTIPHGTHHSEVHMTSQQWRILFYFPTFLQHFNIFVSTDLGQVVVSLQNVEKDNIVQ